MTAMTKVQKKKEAERKARERREWLAHFDKPLIVVNSPGLEKLLKPAPAQMGA